jgi:hypothetical protein
LKLITIFGESSSGCKYVPSRFPESEPFIDANIRFANFLEEHIEILTVSVKRIEIFHEEFSPTQDSGLRTSLISKLRLELVYCTVIEILVRLDKLIHKRCDDFLMSWIQSIILSRSSFYLEEIVHRIPSTSFFPVFACPKRSHENLRTSDSIELFTNNLFNILEDSKSEVEVYISSCHLLTDETCLKKESGGTIIGSLWNSLECMEWIARKLKHDDVNNE